MKKYGKVWESGDVETTLIDPTNAVHLSRMEELGYLPIDEELMSVDRSMLNELDAVVGRFIVEEDRIIFRQELVENAPSKVEKKIKALKLELESTDYIFVKQQEYLLVGSDVEYDIDELHARRETIRERIRELEETEPTYRSTDFSDDNFSDDNNSDI